MRPTELSDLDDATLLERARHEDRAAFGELVQRHQRAALRVAAVIAGSTEEADDIVQEAFVKAHRELASFRGTGTVRSWMLRVVANESKNLVRTRVRRLRRDDRHAGLQIREHQAVDDDVITRDEYRALADALARLNTTDREVLACRFLAELSEAETADALCIAPGTVKSRTSRALGRLRAELGEGT